MKSSSSGETVNKGLFIILGLALCLLIAAGYGLFYLQQINARQAAFIEQKEQEEALELAIDTEERRKEEIQALFDSYLNAFQNELVLRASVYKKTRRLLKNIIHPGNFRNTDFAKENYDLFKESLAPSLRKGSGEIIAVFEHYSNKIEEDLAGTEDDLEKVFLKQWKDMTKEQLDNYVDFFAREEEMIQAFDDLITFYYTHSKRYTFHEERNRIVFKDPDEGMEASMLRKHALELYGIKKKSPGRFVP